MGRHRVARLLGPTARRAAGTAIPPARAAGCASTTKSWTVSVQRDRKLSKISTLAGRGCAGGAGPRPLVPDGAPGPRVDGETRATGGGHRGCASSMRWARRRSRHDATRPAETRPQRSATRHRRPRHRKRGGTVSTAAPQATTPQARRHRRPRHRKHGGTVSTATPQATAPQARRHRRPRHRKRGGTARHDALAPAHGVWLASAQVQARGSATNSVTRAGRVPAATSATLTSSRISRSLARNAIQTSWSARAGPW
ncbi:hypothetical protein GA0070612_3061 [Micromonospora chokoriensis]|uniref:Uncharacterized protein n=1 Tax=Micromonospora chokoriensis TaxID=356851 RepID=A0A1C4WZR8_9ACTN|nr:hypothetical protein GA0070612_3061 [Micromonospora chokoriensis]